MKFLSDYGKFSHQGNAERRCDRNVCGITARGDQDSSNARFVVTRIKSPPAIAKVDFEPGAEVHR